MAYVVNTTEEDFPFKFQGEGYTIPAKKALEVDDLEIAKWMAAKGYLAPSPKEGRLKHEERLLFREQLPEGVEVASKHTFLPAPQPQPQPQPQHQPRKPGEPGIKPPRELLVLDEKAAIAAMNPDKLFKAALDHRLIKKKGNRPPKNELVDQLHAIGFRAPDSGQKNTAPPPPGPEPEGEAPSPERPQK